MLAALILWQTETVHLFFLFVPVWVLTAVLYIIFASMAGAREKFEDEPEELTEQETADEPGEPSVEMPGWTEQPKNTDPVLWICAIAAIASLAACLILPIWVFKSSGENYDQNLEWFKQILIVPTLIYFLTGTIWAVKRNKVD